MPNKQLYYLADKTILSVRFSGNQLVFTLADGHKLIVQGLIDVDKAVLVTTYTGTVQEVSEG